jgi:hypothetical protein
VQQGLLERLILTLPWHPGRQKADYKKILIFLSKRLSMDCWLIYYPSGVSLPRHSDKIKGRDHYRYNFTIVRPSAGGELRSSSHIERNGRLDFFRSDKPHWVTKTVGWRLVLSVGYAPVTPPSNLLDKNETAG